MVHGFALQSGGMASLNSAPGVGTTVRVLLPAAHGDGVAGSQAGPKEATDGDRPAHPGCC